MPGLKNSQNFLFFLKLPNLTNLLTVHLSLHSDVNSYQSEFHLKILTCRKLILAEDDILACPVHDGFAHIIAVIQKEKLKTLEFKEKLNKMGLKIVGVEDTSSFTLQDSLQYTSNVKMSPSWNILENILVEGSDFLTSSAPLKAVKMDVLVSSEEISLSLQPMCIKLPSMKLEHFARPEQLINKEIIHIDEFCHVLPSFKRGRIKSVSRFPGVTGTFKSYEELKKHWGDMYGYILPSVSEENIWYYNVSFRIPYSRSYTYPEFCVKPYGMMQVPRVDPRPILTAFVKDFCKRVGNLCGEKCRVVEGRASFPALELYPAADVSENMKPRAGTTYSMKPNVPYRTNTPTSSTASVTRQQGQSSYEVKGGSNMLSKSVSSTQASRLPSQLEDTTSVKETPDGNQSVLVRTDFTFFSTHKRKLEVHQTMPVPKVSENPQPKIVPRFFPVVKKSSYLSSKEQSSTAKPKPYAPVFLPKRKTTSKQKTSTSQFKSIASTSNVVQGIEAKSESETEKRADPKKNPGVGAGNNETKVKNERAKKKPKASSMEKGLKPSKKLKINP